jgi:glycosyltransferase involved in cell wall biosynthesis
MARVLLVAYSCAPNSGGESGVGWDTALALGSRHDVSVLTRPANKEAIEAAGKRENERVEFLYTPTALLERFSVRGLGISNLRYYLWQRLVRREVRRLCKQKTFDLVHHVTWARCWTPVGAVDGPLPLVVGPVGGGEPLGFPFVRRMSFRSASAEAIRAILARLSWLDPLTRRSVRDSAARIASSRDTADWFARHGSPVNAILPLVNSGNGMTPTTAKETKGHDFLCVGRLLEWKGFAYAIQALAASQLRDATLGVVGEGPQRQRLESLAHSLGLDDRVRFYGSVSRDEVFEMMRVSGTLLHPSLHESGPFVVVEALISGMPVVALDRGGPGVLLDSETGFLIPARTPHQVISDIATAMRTLIEDPERYARMSNAAMERANSALGWQHKVDTISEIYENLMSETVDPRLG